jgi:hypothetical protein
MKKRLLSSLFIILIPLTTFSQVLQDQSANRSEYVFGIGPSVALTDIGGSSLNGTHFLRDFNSRSTRLGGFLGYRKRINNCFSIKGIFTLAELYGNDNLTGNVTRYNRNQDFRTRLVEPSIQVEYHLFRTKRWLRTYDSSKIDEDDDKKSNKNYTESTSPWDLYLFGGIGAFYFNVQGKYNPGGPPPPPGMNTSEWYDLRPLSTEGEGLPGGPAEYSPFAMCIPVGVGLKYALNANWSIGVEFSDRLWTSTDYLDDTHSNYISQAEILKDKGPIAAYFSDPARGSIQNQDLTGQKRGDPKYNDSYMFMFFCVNYHPTFIMYEGHRIRYKSPKTRKNHSRSNHKKMLF